MPKMCNLWFIFNIENPNLVQKNSDFLKGPSIEFFKISNFQLSYAWVNLEERDFRWEPMLRLALLFVQLWNQFCSKFFSKFFNFSTKWMKCFRFFQKLIHSSLRWCPGGVPSPLCPLMNLLIANSKSSLNGFRCCKSLVESRWLTTTIFWG